MVKDLKHCLKIFVQILSTKQLTPEEEKRIGYVKKILRNHQMDNAEYKYKIVDFAGRNCITIEDLCFDEEVTKTVVNDIDSVLSKISIEAKIRSIDYMIVIRNEDGLWDGYNAKEKTFEILQGTNEYHAIRRFIEAQS